MKDIRISVKRPGLYEVTLGNECVVMCHTPQEVSLAAQTMFQLRKVDGIQLLRAPFEWWQVYEDLRHEVFTEFNGTPVELIQVSAFRKRV